MNCTAIKMKNVSGICIIGVLFLVGCGGESGSSEATGQEAAIPEIEINPLQIGEFVFEASNVSLTKFLNGDPIPQAKTDKDYFLP